MMTLQPSTGAPAPEPAGNRPEPAKEPNVRVPPKKEKAKEKSELTPEEVARKKEKAKRKRQRQREKAAEKAQKRQKPSPVSQHSKPPNKTYSVPLSASGDGTCTAGEERAERHPGSWAWHRKDPPKTSAKTGDSYRDEAARPTVTKAGKTLENLSDAHAAKVAKKADFDSSQREPRWRTEESPEPQAKKEKEPVNQYARIKDFTTGVHAGWKQGLSIHSGRTEVKVDLTEVMKPSVKI